LDKPSGAGIVLWPTHFLRSLVFGKEMKKQGIETGGASKYFVGFDFCKLFVWRDLLRVADGI
jgi:hypothetical protein